MYEIQNEVPRADRREWESEQVKGWPAAKKWCVSLMPEKKREKELPLVSLTFAEESSETRLPKKFSIPL